MLLGDIKAEALKIMNVNTFMNVSYMDIDGLKADPTYSGYLYSMIGAINRALDRFYVTEAVTEPIQAITAETSEATELQEYGINDVLARMIPLFIVGDIFAMEEPGIAANNRNLFEASLEEYLNAQRFRQTQVETVYEVPV